MNYRSLTSFVVLAAATVPLAVQAQVEIRLSGAVAFRDTAYRSIRSLFGANLASQNPADSPTAPTQLKVTWTGKLPALYGQQDVTVYAFYNGAVAGVQDLTQNRLVSFLASSAPATTNTVNLPSDLAFSSVFQQATEFTTPTLEDSLFGATPINLVKSSSAPAGLTNITTHQFKTLAANGSVPAWFLTGNTNDTQIVHFINRDPTAGQRVTLFKEALFTGNPIQYAWDTSRGEFVVDPAGRNASQITTHLNSYGPAISYLISVDSFNVNGGQNVLSYNGHKAFVGTFKNTANDFSPVLDGQYSLWVYEHLLNRTTASANVRSFRDALIAAINKELEISAFSVPISRLRVERTADGAPVAPIE
ncbi:MAG: hypothetical protein JNL97_17860 [Verrucomicrobiales bacterium]|nr:hypothetical protein [Verrucomicrobiales bacterium]